MLKIADGFCDHMLLQRQHPILVWGTGEPGESVTVQLANQVGKTLVDATGSWTLSLPPMEAGRQLTLTLFGADTTIQIDDVAIGDLYLAAGQSNMEFALGSEDHYEQARKAADGKDFRWMGVPQVEYEGDGRDEPLAWRVLNAQNVQDVSAVALYALLEIATHTDVPLGVIGCYKGGTRAAGFASKRLWKIRSCGRRFTNRIGTGWKRKAKPRRTPVGRRTKTSWKRTSGRSPTTSAPILSALFPS